MECIQWHPHRITVFPGRFFTKIGKPFYHQNRTVYNHKLQYYTSMTYWFYKKYKKNCALPFYSMWPSLHMIHMWHDPRSSLPHDGHSAWATYDSRPWGYGSKRPVDTNMDASIMAGRSFVDLDPNMYIKFESGSRILAQLRSGSKDMLSILKK